MDTLINVAELLNIVKANRKKHKETYEEAKEVYFVDSTVKLKEALETLTNKKMLLTTLYLPVPESYLEDYDQAIVALGLDTRGEMLLTEQEVSQYIQDKWIWSSSFANNTSSYLSKR